MPRVLHHFLIQHEQEHCPDMTPQEIQQAEAQWTWIEGEIAALIERYPMIHKVYNDSIHEQEGIFGVAGQMGEIQKAMAHLDRDPQVLPPNFRILARLVRNGTELRPTDSKELHEQELAFRAAHPVEELRQNNEMLDRLIDLTDRRDRFIGEKVTADLGDDEVAIILLGANHDIRPYIVGDVEYEIHRGLLRFPDEEED